MDVARTAGVSRSTVSLVLNKSPLVKEETREKVEQVIRELDYVPNYSARSLTNRKMNSIGIIIITADAPDDNDYEYTREVGLFADDITRGIINGLSDTDYSMVIERFCAGAAAQGEIPKLIKSRRVDGALIVGSLYSNEFIERIAGCGVKLVTVAGQKATVVDSVVPDPSEGAYLEVKHLLETGHKNICFVNCPKVFRSNYQRIEGFGRAMSEADGRLTNSRLIDCAENTGEGGYHAFRRIWESGERPDGIVTANTAIAMGVMRYLYEQKVRVPEQVSVVSYEDSLLSGYCAPPLTTVNIQKELMGKTAAQILLKRFANPGKKIESVTIQPYLVKRMSVRDRME